MRKISWTPYSFSVIKDGNWYEYRVTKYPSPTLLANGYVPSRKDAEKQARLAIQSLMRATEGRAA